MTLGEALAELGIHPGVEPEEARRAYLRLLKTRKPEVDPQGFLRLREAYEVVRGVGHLLRPPVGVTAGSGKTLYATVASSPPGEPHEPAPTSSAAVEEGTARTDPISESSIATTPLEELRELLAKRDANRASARLATIYADAAQCLDVFTPPPPSLAIDLLFTMHESCSVDEADRLHDAFRRWLETTGQEVRVLGHLCGPWALLSELRGLPRNLSAPVRAAVASAARTGDLGQARSTLQRLRFANQAAAMADAQALRTRGGPFCKKLADCLYQVAAPTSKRRWIFTLVPMMILMLRGLVPLGSNFAPAEGVHHEASSETMSATHEAAASAKRLATEAERAGAPVIADRARGIYSALRTGDCSSARYHADAMGDGPIPTEIRAHVDQVKADVQVVCAGPGERR